MNEQNTEKRIPAPGEVFAYQDTKFIALGMEQGGLLALAEPVEKELQFDKKGSNDWRESSIRKYLNRIWIQRMDKDDLLEIESDLTSDCGQKDYGTSRDYVALLSDDLFRKYREIVLPWLTDHGVYFSCHLTPWRTPDAGNAYHVRVCLAGNDGALNSSNASSSYGAAPLVLFNPASFNRPVRDEEP